MDDYNSEHATATILTLLWLSWVEQVEDRPSELYASRPCHSYLGLEDKQKTSCEKLRDCRDYAQSGGVFGMMKAKKEGERDGEIHRMQLGSVEDYDGLLLSRSPF